MTTRTTGLVDVEGERGVDRLRRLFEDTRNGAANSESHFSLAAGRGHQSWREYFDGLRRAVD